MADAGLVLRQTMTAIAEAIRTKGGASGNLRPSQMAQAILSISGGGGGGGGGVTTPEFLAHSDASKVLVNAYYGDYDSKTPAWGGLTVTGRPAYDVAGISVSSGTGFSYPLGEQNHDVTVYAIVRGGPDYKTPLSVAAAEENNKCPAFNVLNGNWGIISWGSDTRLSYSAAQYSVLTMAIDTQNGTAKFYVNGTAQGNKPIVASGDTVRFNGSLNHSSSHYAGNFQYLYAGIVDGCEDEATILANQMDMLPLAQDGRIGIPSRGDGTKYGLSVGAYLGDPDANCVLQKPSLATADIDFVFSPNIEDIAAGALENAFLDGGKVTGGSIRSVTFPELSAITGNRALYYAFNGISSLASVSMPMLETVNGTAVLRAAFAQGGLSSVNMPRLKTITGNNACRTVFYLTKLKRLDLPALESISGEEACEYFAEEATLLEQFDLSSLKSVSGNHAFKQAFHKCTALSSASFPSLESIRNGTGTNQGAFEYTFEACTSLQSVNFSSLETISGRGTLWCCFYGCTSLTSVGFPALKTINSGYAPIGQMFRGCTRLTSISFPSLISVNTDSFAEFAYGSSLTEVHFRADMQATIEALNGYSSNFGRGAGNMTIYFDL